jgi:hypothetical protein
MSWGEGFSSAHLLREPGKPDGMPAPRDYDGRQPAVATPEAGTAS